MVGGLGVEDRLKGLHEAHFLLCDLFVGLGKKGSVDFKIKNMW
jgi:hypothetical protein